MSMPEGCPCEAVKKIEDLIREHDRQINDGNVKFALMQQDIGWIKAKLEEKRKFSSGIAASIISGIICTVAALIIGFLAGKIGIV